MHIVLIELFNFKIVQNNISFLPKADKTQPTVPSPPQHKIWKFGILEKNFNLKMEIVSGKNRFFMYSESSCIGLQTEC